MYFRTKCPYCEKPAYHNVRLHALAHIEVRGSIRERELCRTIKDNYCVAARYCCDIIECIKIDLCMYSPDRKHLKVIE